MAFLLYSFDFITKKYFSPHKNKSLLKNCTNTFKSSYVLFIDPMVNISNFIIAYCLLLPYNTITNLSHCPLAKGQVQLLFKIYER